MKAVEILRKILQKFRQKEIEKPEIEQETIKQQEIEQREIEQETIKQQEVGLKLIKQQEQQEQEENKKQNSRWTDKESFKEEEETEIKELKIKSEDESSMKVEFVFANGRVFLKKFKKGVFNYRVGQKIKMVIGSDHIMRDICPSN